MHQFEENERNQYTSFFDYVERAVRRATTKPTPDPTEPTAQAEPLPLV